MSTRNPKQLAFAERYLATGNAAQSDIAAGYQVAGRLLGNAGVNAAVAAATQKA